MQNALYSPFVSRLNPKDVGLVWATHQYLVGALSGKRGFDTMRVEMTFLWMSEFNMCERVDGVRSIFISLLTFDRLADKIKLASSVRTIIINFSFFFFLSFFLYNLLLVNDWESLVVSGIQPYWSAKAFLWRYWLSGWRSKALSLVLTRWSKHSLHRHIPVPAIILAANVALMVWSNHDEDKLVKEAIWRASCIHGHRTLKAPHPVRSAQLTRVPPS